MANSFFGSPFNQQMVYQPQQAQTSSLVWVNGQEGAFNYPVARGNTVLLLDSQDSMFYLKSMDLTGNTSIKKFKFEEIVEQKPKDPEFTIADVINRMDAKENATFKLLDEQLALIKDLEDKVNRLESKSTGWSNKTHKTYKENKE